MEFQWGLTRDLNIRNTKTLAIERHKEHAYQISGNAKEVGITKTLMFN